MRFSKPVDFWDYHGPGDATKYIEHANINPGDRVVLVCRVSTCNQGKRKNHSDQEAALREWVKERGGIVVDVVKIVISGFNPYWLARAVAIAERRSAKLLAESTDRFIRHPAYHSVECPNAQPSNCELRDLRDWAEGTELVTMLHPNATLEEVRSYQSKRGQRMKRKKGGRRERLKNRRKRLEAKVLELRQSGASFREIEKQIGVPFNTARRWCLKNECTISS